MSTADKQPAFTGPPEINCACPVWDAWDCVGIRYGLTREQLELDRATGNSECECYCHDAYDEWNRSDDDDDY